MIQLFTLTNLLIYYVEEKKDLARQYRLAAKKEKKKAKSDAKKQRKENAILQRRATRNNEKYVKNKDRNKQRAIDLERWKIWTAAIAQCERLAAKHDSSGKLFNVGEVVVLPDGKVRSKEAITRAQEAKEKRDAERREAEAEKAAREAAKKALKEGKLPAAVAEGVNPARQALIQNLEAVGGSANKKTLSNAQRKRQELYAPKPVPPKPVLPEGYSLPEGEEDFLSLWDITDEAIQARIIKEKSQKGMERRALRKAQKAQQVINKQLKIRKKQAANQGVLFDRAAALKEIMALKNESDSDDSGSDSDSDSDDKEYDSDGRRIEEPKADNKTEKKSPAVKTKSKKEATLEESDSSSSDSNSSSGEEEKVVPEIKAKAQGSKRSAPEPVEDEPKSKKSKKSKKPKEEASVVFKGVKKEPEVTPTVQVPKVDSKSAKKEKSQTSEDKVLAVSEGETVVETAQEPEFNGKVSKKSKKPKNKVPVAEGEEQTVQEVAAPEPEIDAEAAKKERRRKKKEQKELAKLNESVKQSNLHTEAQIPQSEEKSSKKRKHAEEEPHENGASEKKQKKKKQSKTEEPAATIAEQWNPDALTGDAVRKEKFLRLLGAGKSNGVEATSKYKSTSKATDLERVQNELEQQFEAGLKLKRKHYLS